jgi:hypothetical protein
MTSLSPLLGQSIRVTVEVFVDYRSLDLISAKLGESDFIVHSTKPSALSHPATPPQDEEEGEHSPETSLQRTNSDEEDKGLITEELLKTPSTESSPLGKKTSPSSHAVATATAAGPVADMDAEDEEQLLAANVPQPVTTIRLEDVLILKIENGRDYFLTVTAEFEPTAEGSRTLSSLSLSLHLTLSLSLSLSVSPSLSVSQISISCNYKRLKSKLSLRWKK